MGDTLDYKINLDTSDLQREQMRMQMMAQQQAQAMAGTYSNMATPGDYSGNIVAQQQAMMMASQSAMQMSGMSGLDPRASYAQSAYMSSMQSMSPMTSNMVGLYGEPTMSPRFQSGADYQYPRGYIPGKPDFPENNMKSFAGNMGSYASAVGLNVASGMLGLGKGLGVGSAIDDPIYRQIQSMTENPMHQAASGVMSGMNHAANGAFMLASTASSFLLPAPISVPLNIGLMVGQQISENSFKGVNQYMEMGDYFRDAMAPNIRSNRLGGGPDGKQMAKFTRAMGKMAANDDRFTRDDEQNILKLGVDEGFMQSADNVDKAAKVVENLGRNLRSMYELGIKVKDTQSVVQQMNQMGVNMAGTGTAAQSFMGLTSLAAFQSSQTVNQMLPSLVQASSLFAQQGLAPSLGAQLHAMSQGVTGESIRGGVFSQEDRAYFGGQQGISDSLTRVYSNVNRSTMGNLMGLTMANNPSLAGKDITTSQMINQMNGFSDPNKYFELQMNMPELSRKIGEKDPSAFGSGMMKNIVNMMTSSMGKDKIGAGELYAMLMNQDIAGLTPQDARAFMKTVQGSDKAAAGAEESMLNKTRQIQLEGYRNMMSPFSEVGRKNLMEKAFEIPVSNFAANLQEKMYGASEWMEDKLISNTTGGEVIRTKKQTGSEFANNFMRTIRGQNTEDRDVYTGLNKVSKEIVESSAPDSVLKGVQRKMEAELKERTNDSIKLIEGATNQRITSKVVGEGAIISQKELQEILENAKGKGGVSDDDVLKLQKYISGQKTDGEVNKETKLIVDTLKGLKVNNVDIVNNTKNTDRDRGKFAGNLANGELNKKSKDIVSNLQITGDDDKMLGDLFKGQLTDTDKIKDPMGFKDKIYDVVAQAHGHANYKSLSDEDKKNIADQAPAFIRDMVEGSGNSHYRAGMKDLSDKMSKVSESAPEKLMGKYKDRLSNEGDEFSMAYSSLTGKGARNVDNVNDIEYNTILLKKNVVESLMKNPKHYKEDLNRILESSADLGKDGNGISRKGRLMKALASGKQSEINKELKGLSDSYIGDLANLEGGLSEGEKNIASDRYKNLKNNPKELAHVGAGSDNFLDFFTRDKDYEKDRRGLDSLKYMITEESMSGISEHMNALGISDSSWSKWGTFGNQQNALLKALGTGKVDGAGARDVLGILSGSSKDDIKSIAGLGKNILDKDLLGSKAGGTAKKKAIDDIKRMISGLSKGTMTEKQTADLDKDLSDGDSLNASGYIIKAIGQYAGKEGGSIVTNGDTTMLSKTAKSLDGILKGFQDEREDLKNLQEIRAKIVSSDKSLTQIVKQNAQHNTNLEHMLTAVTQQRTLNYGGMQNNFKTDGSGITQ